MNMKEKNIIDTTLQTMLEQNEVKTVKMLYGILSEVYEKYGDITDNEIKKYNDSEDGQYFIKISVSTIRNYLKQFHYVVKKDDNCIVREMTVDEYVEAREKLDALNKENYEAPKTDNRSVAEKLALSYVSKSEEYKDQKLMSIRCSAIVQSRLDDLCKKYPMFNKQYLLSFLLDTALKNLED